MKLNEVHSIIQNLWEKGLQDLEQNGLKSHLLQKVLFFEAV